MIFIYIASVIALLVIPYIILQVVIALIPISIKKPKEIAIYIILVFVTLILSTLISAAVNYNGVIQKRYDAILQLVLEKVIAATNQEKDSGIDTPVEGTKIFQGSESDIPTESIDVEEGDSNLEEIDIVTEMPTEDRDDNKQDSEKIDIPDFEESESLESSEALVSETEITGNSFSGELVSEGQRDCYVYTPAVSGRYRFDFNSNNANGDYKFYVYTSDGKELAFSRYSNKGKTVDLSAGGKTYHIIVEQCNESMQYTVSIGTPLAVIPIYEPVITGAITYVDQCNYYTFAAPTSGRYRFDFSSDDVQCDYRFYLLKSDNDTIISSRYSLNGKSAELVEGETYTMIVEQSSGFPNYIITIGAPNPVQAINAASFSGSISYIDQINRYTYTAPVTGIYRFDLLTDNVQAQYKFYLYASDETLLVNGWSNSGKNVSLTANEIYDIYVRQNSGFENYTINIGVPNSPSNIENNVITGNISYVGQENTYMFTAPITGNYTFTFGTNDATADYRFYVISSINQRLASAYYSSGKKNVQLEGGQIYTIVVTQYSGLPSYEITIDVQE